MNETYGRVQDSSLYYENQAKVSLVCEAITVKRFFYRFILHTRLVKVLSGFNLCPRRFVAVSHQPNPLEAEIQKLEKNFEAQEGYLYFAEEINKDEYLAVMAERTKAIKEEKKENDDTGNVTGENNSIKDEIRDLLRSEFKNLAKESFGNSERKKGK